jgi:hypothetical protein
LIPGIRVDATHVPATARRKRKRKRFIKDIIHHKCTIPAKAGIHGPPPLQGWVAVFTFSEIPLGFPPFSSFPKLFQYLQQLLF